MLLKDQVCVVLVQPQNAGNVGAVARCLLNTGIHDLRLVLPQCDPLSTESLDRAREAKHLIAKSRIHLCVADALDDCHFSWGTSRKGRHTSPDLFTPPQMAQHIFNHPQSKHALVFGPEDRGLNNDELKVCDALLTIPSSEEFPSLNLSHAVMVCLYEVYQLWAAHQHQPLPKTPKQLATSQSREGLYAHLKEALLHIGFLDHHNPERLMRDLRTLYARSALTEREVTILRGICRQILNRCS